MTKYFSEKEYKMIDAINIALFEYIESVDQTEEVNAPKEVHDIREFLESMVHHCFKLQFSQELEKALDKFNTRNIVPFNKIA